jgi:type IV pilus assembly protein PilE
MHPPSDKALQARCRRSDGFSSLELMVVLATLAILAAFQYPSYQEAVRKTRRAEARTALLQLMQQEERYYTQHTTYVIFSSATSNGFKWYSGDSPPTSAYEISATACKGEVIQNCVMLTAEPGTAKVNSHFRDDACKSLTLTSNGAQAATGNTMPCW